MTFLFGTALRLPFYSQSERDPSHTNQDQEFGKGSNTKISKASRNNISVLQSDSFAIRVAVIQSYSGNS